MTTIEKKLTKKGSLRFYIFNGCRKVMISRIEAEQMIASCEAEYGKLFY